MRTLNLGILAHVDAGKTSLTVLPTTTSQAPATVTHHHFAPPTLESVVSPRRSSDAGALHAALAQLAEQDPLVNLRQDDTRHELAVSLYGEVQKEVIQATLAAEYGIEVGFRETTVICVERPTGTGVAVEHLGKDGNPFRATVGLRVDPAPPGSGLRFHLEIPPDTLGAVMSALIRAHAVVTSQESGRAGSMLLMGEIPVAQVHQPQQLIPALTRGEGVLETEFASYRPVTTSTATNGSHGPSSIPTRPRTDHNPLNRKEYLLHVTRRV